jgi:hypothetical protein
MLVAISIRRIAAALALSIVLLAPWVATAGSRDGRTLYSSPTNHVEYPRAIQLGKHTILVAFPIYYDVNDSVMRFYQSNDAGRSFRFVTDFRDPEPLDIGAPALMKAPDGSLLFAYNLMDTNSFRSGQKIKVWRSTDQGATWTHLATPEPGGMWCWEPEFAISLDGKLQLYYSYAGQVMNTFAQSIVRRESSDAGVTWSEPTVAVGDRRNHVGMARVVETEDRYLMAFEHYESFAAVRVVESSDGKVWSSVPSAATMEVPGDGWMFSTPALAYVDGALIGTGKRYYDRAADRTFTSDENEGRVLLRSTDSGRTWEEICSPLAVQFNDFSSNWSPTLLPISKKRLFMITNSDRDDLHRMQYGVRRIRKSGQPCR